MNIIDTLIFDRKEEDVQYVQLLSFLSLFGMSSDQLGDFLSGLKGSYNVNDLNRVESAVEYIIEKLKPTGNYLDLKTKTSWEVTEWVTESESLRYTDNIRAIRNCFVAPFDMPEVPEDLNKLEFEGANNIEKILFMIDYIIDNVSKSWLYSGDIYSGEV